MKRLAALLFLIAVPCLAQDDLGARVDAIFANYAKPDSPGCAVGVARAGKTLLERAYGMANLEYNVPLTASTIFEAGSVSKQFTAASVLLLAQDGKLSLDDPVRKYGSPRSSVLGPAPPNRGPRTEDCRTFSTSSRGSARSTSRRARNGRTATAATTSPRSSSSASAESPSPISPASESLLPSA